MQEELRLEGARVVGSGNSGELEMDREKAKQVLKDRGLPSPKHDFVTGIDALEKILREKKDLYIKLNTEDRGIMETFHHVDWQGTRGKFYELAYKLKCFRDTTKFLWEEPWEGIEVGQDKWMVQGRDFKESLFGIELKGDGYICRHLKAEDFPTPIKKVNEALSPVELKYKTSAAISSEIRVGPKGAYYGDFTRRQGNPPTACITAIYKNLGPIIAGIADGEEVKPEWNAEYAAELSVEVSGAEKEEVAMDLKETDFKTIKLRAACRINGMYYNIPNEGVGNVVVKAVGLGDSREEAEFNSIETAEKFTTKCKGAFFSGSTFESLEDEIHKGAKYGLDPNKF